MNVFDGNSCVVDQYADRECEAAQRHGVHRFAHGAEDDDGAENRERNRDRDDERASPASEEQKDHQCVRHASDDALAKHSLDRSTDKEGLIEEFCDLSNLLERPRGRWQNIGA